MAPTSRSKRVLWYGTIEMQTLTLDPTKPRNYWITWKISLLMNQWLLRGPKTLYKLSHRWSKTTEWETNPLEVDIEWKRIVKPIIRLYTEATDGSNIEIKESALVWNHRDANPDVGSC
ncbi:hypothetical protein QYF36_015692 [Acer negundo]|nr:hypothetical protein QYF36_015692 [Acer negundo]